YWARGLYQVRYDLLDQWKAGGLSAGERRRLPALVKRLETINLRQSTLYRLLETVGRLQAAYLASGKEEELLPISLRQLARRHVLRELLGQWLAQDASVTDAALAQRLKTERGIAVSRRTVNAVRHELRKTKR